MLPKRFGVGDEPMASFVSTIPPTFRVKPCEIGVKSLFPRLSFSQVFYKNDEPPIPEKVGTDATLSEKFKNNKII